MDRNTARRGITLVVSIVTVVMVLVFCLSVNPAGADASLAAPHIVPMLFRECGNGSAPDYGFTYDLQQAHWTVDWQGYASEQTVTNGDKITICHATSSKKNPYNEITVSLNGLNGHDKHDGDIIPAPAGGCPETK